MKDIRSRGLNYFRLVKWHFMALCCVLIGTTITTPLQECLLPRDAINYNVGVKKVKNTKNTKRVVS